MAQLLSNLPIHSLIKFGKHSVVSEATQPIIWRVIDKNHSGYPTDSVTLITNKIIDIREYDNQETSNLWGSINYSLSNIHQWLNSEGSANNWYKASHSYDAAPSYKSRPGFLYNFTERERLALLTTTFKEQVQTTAIYDMSGKVFLPSVKEVLGTFAYEDGSTRLAGFASYDTQAYLTSQAFANTSSSEKPASVDIPISYLTRSTQYDAREDMDGIAYIGSGGALVSLQLPYYDSGVRPCVNLSKNTIVSDSTDSDGCYTVIFNDSPIISGTNSNLGIKGSGFSQSYTVTDANNNTVTVTEYIDNLKVRSYVATLGATNTFSITGATWLKLANGVHTLKVVATDGFSEMVRTYTFTKSVTKLVVQRSTPFDSTARAKSILVTVVKVIPDEAIFKVEACNNGYDASPTWEDITTRVVQGRIYDFVNTSKTATKWGVNIRVTVDRNGKEGACYITEIGGNFE
jgi:hypothetical protein